MSSTDPVLALEKRVNRGRVARHLEQAGTWVAVDDSAFSDNRRIIRHPAGVSIWLFLGVGTPWFVVPAIMNKDAADFEVNDTWLIICLVVLAILNVYFTVLPAIVRKMYAPPRLNELQNNAIRTYEKLDEDDRRAVRPALYEFIRVNDYFNVEKFNHRERIWHRTVDAVAEANSLQHELELTTPTDAEHNLTTLLARNKEIQQQVEELR